MEMTIEQWHKKQAVDNFNATWDLIDKADRSPEDNLQMIHTAHASRYHWGQIGGPVEFARGEWQISRVYALVGLAEGALYHGEHSLRYCLDNGIGDFDMAFAYEAVARAYMLRGDIAQLAEYLDKALNAAKNIAKDGDRDYLLSELATISL